MSRFLRMIGGVSKINVFGPRISPLEPCHLLVLELSRAHEEGKAATPSDSLVLDKC